METRGASVIDTIDLNKPQRDAVMHSAGPLLVLAGPGTGKTRVIIARLLRLLEEGADPTSLLAVTFSVKATEEMRERLALWARPGGDALVAAASRVQVSTFNSLGRRIARRFADALGIRPETTLLDAAVTKRTLRTLIAEMGLFPAFAGSGHASIIDEHAAFEAACKHNARSPEDAVMYAAKWRERLATEHHNLSGEALMAETLAKAHFESHARLYAAFDSHCLFRGLTTFDDDLAYPLRIFRKRPELASFLRAEFRHVVVDELQDVNAAQLELMKWIAPPVASGGATDLCAVGDDDQAIYAFRGSDPAAVLAFKKTWADHHTIPLTENHRSAPRVIEVGNAVIQRAVARVEAGKTIVAAGKHPTPGTVEAYTVKAEPDHGPLIAALILADRAKNPERKWSDFAVLVRGSGQLDQCAAALSLKNIPIDTRTRATPLTDPGVQDLLSWINLLCNPKDDGSAQRLLVRPPTGIAPQTIRAWRETHANARRAARVEGHDFPAFIDWAIAQHADNPELQRLGTLLTELRRAAATLPADQCIEHIVRQAHLAGGDGPEALDPSQRAARARALVSVLRFTRACQPNLDHPADLGAFLAYYNDLDDDGQNFRSLGSDDDNASSGTDERPDAVSVITAHRAKGLEWDTVFVPKVSPGRGGYSIGKREEPGDHELPAEFLGRDGSADSDEELRLFYVACTRAKRRLVLSAKTKKTPGPKAVPDADLFQYLTHFSPQLAIPVHTMDEALRAAGAEAPTELESELASRRASAESRAELLRRETAFVRQSAFAALHDAAAAGTSEAAPDLAPIESRLIDAAHAVAALARLNGDATSRNTPTHAAPTHSGPLVRRVHELARRLASPNLETPWPPPHAPFHLSFTQIKAFLDCPRCWYLKYVLGLESRSSTEADIGTIAHTALQRFYAAWREHDDGSEASLPAPAELHRLADTAFDERFPPLHPDRDHQRARLHAQFDSLLKHLHPTTHQVLELELNITMPFTDSKGNAHTLTAKIDRLDLSDNGEHRLIDYKTGKPAKYLLEPKKDDLQLGIYALALAHHLAEPQPQGVAEYWVLSEGKAGVIALADLDLDKVRATIDKAAIGMLTPPYTRGKACSTHCDLLGA